MTLRGEMMSVTRHGLNRADTGPLVKVAFEETTEMLFKAGRYYKQDSLTGVVSNIS